jgi:hypothetical protein
MSSIFDKWSQVSFIIKIIHIMLNLKVVKFKKALDLNPAHHQAGLISLINKVDGS